MDEDRIGDRTEREPLGLASPPEGSGRRGNRWRSARVGAAIVIALTGLVLVVAASAYAYFYVKGVFVFGSRVWTSPMQRAVAWTGDGDWLMAQLRDRDGRAVACAWSPASGRTRTLVGYRIVAVNEFEPVSMVARDPGHTLFELQSASRAEKQVFSKEYLAMGTATGFLDDPVIGGVSRWDLRTGDLSASSGEGAWGTWVGHGSRRVSMSFDASRGAWPCALRFERQGRPAVLASEPGATGTVIPLGWTADGSAFAVVRCVSAQAASAATEVTTAPATITTVVSLLSTADGSTLASTTIQASPFDAASWHVALDPSRGEIVVLTRWLRSARLLSISASEGVRPIDLPPRAEAGTATVPVWLLGYDGQGVSFATVWSARPTPQPPGSNETGRPWAVWSTRGTHSVWSQWVLTGPQWAFDRRHGIAWIHVVDFPEQLTLPGVFPEPVTGTEDVMWSRVPSMPGKRVMQGYYSFVF